MFIDPNDLIEVSDDEGNTISVKRKMDLATETAVMVSFNEINRNSPNLTQAAYNLALLQHNVKKWEGPAFANGDGPVPCTKSNIGRLDASAPLLVQALKKIDELNTAETAEVDDDETDPNSDAGATSTG